jgi:polyhydroxyalkanoate synthesis regulator phasin
LQKPVGTNEAESSNAKSMDELAQDLADNSSSTEQISQDIDAMVQNGQLSSEEAATLKARIDALRNAASTQPDSQQPKTMEEFVQYYREYDAETLSQIKKFQNLYDQYSRIQGTDASITQAAWQAFNQVKLRENNNLIIINEEINQLLINGTLTSNQANWLKEHIQKLRTP